MSQTYAFRITADASNFRAAAEQTTALLAGMGAGANGAASALRALGSRGGADLAPLTDAASTAVNAIGSLSTAVRATTLLSGIGALASAAVAVYEVFKNWDAITESIGRGLDFIAGRARTSAQAVTGLREAIAAVGQLRESPDQTREREARAATDRALAPIRAAIGPARAEIQALEAERAGLQGNELRQRLERPGRLPSAAIDRIVAQREQRNAARIAELDARIAERQNLVTQLEGDIAAAPVAGLFGTPAGPAAPIVETAPRAGRGGSGSGRAAQELPQFGPGMADFIASQRQLTSEANRLIESTRTPEEQRTARLERYNELLGSGAIEQETYNRAVAALAPAAEVANQSFGKLSGAISNAIEDFITGTKSLGDAVKSLALDISRIVLRSAVSGPLSSLLGNGLGSIGSELSSALSGSATIAAANGAVFGGSGVVPFARGGVVNRATLFPFAGGTGLMGEAGPEAIMPLRRGRDGKLGVASEGGATVNITINSPDADGFRRSADQVTAAVADGVRRGGRLR